MKKIIGILVCFAFLLVAVGSVYADPYEARPHEWRDKQTFRKKVQFPSGSELELLTGATLTVPAGKISATDIADVVRYINLPLNAFVIENIAGASVSPITANTSPSFQLDDYLPNIAWADGNTTPVRATFRIPSIYVSGGAFKILATESNSSTPNKIDFDVYVNTPDSPTGYDSSATDQTPVALAGTTSTPDEVTLTPATDFDSLVAGDWVTLRLWRDDAADGSGDLEIKGIEFYFTAKQ